MFRDDGVAMETESPWILRDVGGVGVDENAHMPRLLRVPHLLGEAHGSSHPRHGDGAVEGDAQRAQLLEVLAPAVVHVHHASLHNNTHSEHTTDALHWCVRGLHGYRGRSGGAVGAVSLAVQRNLFELLPLGIDQPERVGLRPVGAGQACDWLKRSWMREWQADAHLEGNCSVA